MHCLPGEISKHPDSRWEPPPVTIDGSTGRGFHDAKEVLLRRRRQWICVRSDPRRSRSGSREVWW